MMKNHSLSVKGEKASQVSGSRICSQCGFVEMIHEGQGHRPNQTPCKRLGLKSKPGRSFHIALMAATILGRYNLDVGIYRAGVCRDRDRIVGIPMINQVYHTEDASQITPGGKEQRLGSRKYDIVLLNETIQSLDHPNELSDILADLNDDGVAVASTDLNDGSNLSKSLFLASPVTQVMWSEESLRHICADAGFHLDSRLPKIAVTNRLGRKRYVFFYKSDRVENDIRLFFSKTAYAPSEA